MRRGDLVREHPMLYHMAADGTWPAIQARGLLSTQAIVDLYAPPPPGRAEILSVVRRTAITLDDPVLGPAVIRDQTPLRFLDECLQPGTSAQEFLHALNNRVFFWLTRQRLGTLLNARLNRQLAHTVLSVDTGELLARYGDQVQLSPYNTGSTYARTSPRRGPDIFVDVEEYPHDAWRARRGKTGDAVVELTLPYSVPDIVDMTVRVERWAGGVPVETLFERASAPVTG
ncbi:MAG TPA: hypothetical protein VGL80_08750 [Pseudonocardiaceae bacterium]